MMFNIAATDLLYSNARFNPDGTPRDRYYVRRSLLRNLCNASPDMRSLGSRPSNQALAKIAIPGWRLLFKRVVESI